MISNYDVLTTMGLGLLVALEDAFQDAPDPAIESSTTVETSYGCSVTVEVTIGLGLALEENHASVKIFIDHNETAIYEIKYKLPAHPWHGKSFNSCPWEFEDFKCNSDKKSLLHLNAGCEAITSVMSDTIHEYSTLYPILSR